MANQSIFIWKMAISSALSWEAAKWAGSDHPYLAPLTVILSLQPTISQSLQYTLQRILGTVLGIAFASYLAVRMPMNGWTLGILILGGTFIAKWLKFDGGVLRQAALTILLVFAFERHSHTYAWDRILDTIIGAVIAVLVHMVLFPPAFINRAESSVKDLDKQMAAILPGIAGWIELGAAQGKAGELDWALRAAMESLHKARMNTEKASAALKFNPFRKKDEGRLEEIKAGLQRMGKVCVSLAAIVGTLKDAENETLWRNAELAGMTRRIGNYIEHYKHQGLGMGEDMLQPDIEEAIRQSGNIHLAAVYLEMKKILILLKIRTGPQE
ncbi:FUSC family protein [Bacillus infantis]|uniref:FUSC family protein n=1 Tax=Bacillus infantis TaxID=324767 RepID=UPI001CD4D37D|nr:FUSC family protein [Bacillus infantis]MCA1040127.1 FUSC family protein [Bacillus infantis]